MRGFGEAELAVSIRWTLTYGSHDEFGQKVSDLGVELLAELDSYGPVEPAKGERVEQHTSTLSIEDDPFWSYSGHAIFTVNGNADQKTPEEAFSALCQYLIDTGWRENGQDYAGRTWFARAGGLGLTVRPPDGDETITGYQSSNPTARIFFSIDSK